MLFLPIIGDDAGPAVKAIPPFNPEPPADVPGPVSPCIPDGPDPNLDIWGAPAGGIVRVVGNPMPTDCGEDSIVIAVIDGVPAEAQRPVIAALAAANGLKDKEAGTIEVAGGVVVVAVFGSTKTLADVLKLVTEVVVVCVGTENEKGFGELNPPNWKIRWVGCGNIGAVVVTDAVVDVGPVVADAEIYGDELIEHPVPAWEEGGNNAASVAEMNVGAVAAEIGVMKLGEEAARLDVKTGTLAIDGSLVLLHFCSIARSTEMRVVLMAGGAGRGELQNLHLTSVLRVR